MSLKRKTALKSMPLMSCNEGALPVLFVVPAPIAQIDTTEESDTLIHNDQLFVMSPKQNSGGNVIRMAEYPNVWVLGAKLLLAVKRIDAQGQFHFFV